MNDQKPVVRRAFKYGKKSYKPGDVFEPSGEKNDAMILKSSLIVYKSVEAPETRQRGRAKNAQNHTPRAD